jgi:hypothetical protein
MPWGYSDVYFHAYLGFSYKLFRYSFPTESKANEWNFDGIHGARKYIIMA